MPKTEDEKRKAATERQRRRRAKLKNLKRVRRDYAATEAEHNILKMTLEAVRRESK